MYVNECISVSVYMCDYVNVCMSECVNVCECVSVCVDQRTVLGVSVPLVPCFRVCYSPQQARQFPYFSRLHLHLTQECWSCRSSCCI